MSKIKSILRNRTKDEEYDSNEDEEETHSEDEEECDSDSSQYSDQSNSSAEEENQINENVFNCYENCYEFRVFIFNSFYYLICIFRSI
jgi:hypothetical protein